MNFIFKLSYTQIIVSYFFALIFFSGFLLCLPVSSKTGEWTPFIDSVFTSTSALCITGFAIYDTWTHWSFFGQFVILLLIQTGGIGFMTIIVIFSVFINRKIGLHERQLLAQSVGIMQIGGVIRLIKRIFKIVLIIEFSGVIILAIRFCPQMGFLSGLWNAVFHSISAFCNAGFDLMGKFKEFSSLAHYATDTTVMVTVILLTFIGTLGFVVLDDIIIYKFRFSKYSIHSKIVLFVTGILIFLGWILYYLFEFNGFLKDFTIGGKITIALFQSVASKTSGLNVVNTTQLTEASILLTIVLMFIGGSSGSTAGGIKTTTLAILVLNACNSFRKTHSMVVFKRKLDEKTVKRAAAIVSIYTFVFFVATFILCAVESFTLKEAMFEAGSALGSVGLSIGIISSSLGATGKIIIIILMFAGRIGWLTLLIAFAKKRITPLVERPTEKILIG